MKLRIGFLLLLAMALIAAGCGDDDKDSKKDDKKSGKQTESQKIETAKRDALDDAKKAFDKKKTDVNVCRDLAMRYIAVASPESTNDPKKAPELPKDRDKSLKGAVNTLESCTKIDNKNRDVKQMLASTYMATGKYDKAAPLLKELAGSAKGQERANAYYAWGLAASNATDDPSAIKAWQTFATLAPAKDPRIAQVKQSIKALQAAKSAPKPAAKADDEGDKSDDKGSDDKNGDEGGDDN